VRPTTVRPLGVLQREGRPSNVAREPDETVDYPEVDVPLVVVAGTSMESGKTSAAAAAVAALASNHRVAGVKLTGTALRKDIERLSEAGADVTADFSDAGILCTKTAAETRHAIGTILPEVEQSVDVIVAELGGGIITFGPEHALASRLTEQIDLFVFAAGDEVAAAGGVCILRDQYGVDPDAIVGPACDTALGRERIAERTGVETVATVDEASRRSFRRLVVARIDA
jgi:Ni2+-binding GTPase involved in maturation of urease and hydrogenase